MSRVYLEPTKDATIYEVFSTLNTGYDEILEVGKLRNDKEFTNGVNVYLSDIKFLERGFWILNANTICF